MMNKLPIKLAGLYLDIKLIRARKVIGWSWYAYNLQLTLKWRSLTFREHNEGLRFHQGVLRTFLGKTKYFFCLPYNVQLDYIFLQVSSFIALDAEKCEDSLSVSKSIALETC